MHTEAGSWPNKESDNMIGQELSNVNLIFISW